MSRTEDRMLREGAFLSPYDVAAQQDHGKMMEAVDVIDERSVGGVKVMHTAGRPLDPFAPLHGDPSATSYGPVQPPVTVRVVHSRIKP